MSIDLPTLITKLRTAPQKSGTYGRGDRKPLDQFDVQVTAEERDWLANTLEVMRFRQTLEEG